MSATASVAGQALSQPTATNETPQLAAPSGHASLYVGDLDEDVTEAMVYEKFAAIGQILSIRVCRDMISRKSLGYAYVNFATTAEAEKAIDQLNFDTLRNRQMRIMWSQRDPSLRKSGVGNLFIKNLDKSIQVRDLYDTFSTFGNILSCKIACDEKGHSKGFGFLHFTSKEASDSAMKRLNGMLLKDKKIYVGPFVARSHRSNHGAGDSNFNNVFVKNFGEDMDEERLKNMFSQYGEITSHTVMKNDEGVSRGFGFVCFKEPKDAAAAVAALNNSDCNGRTLYVGRAMKKNERLDYLRNQIERKKADKSSRYAVGVNLYVKNLDDNMDEEALRKEFSLHGNITSVKVMRDASGRSKGFGFVCFSYPDEATKAVTEMSGKLVGGKPLYVALAQRKEERRLHLQGQHAQRQFIRGPVPQYSALQGNPLAQQAFTGNGVNFFLPGGFPNNQASAMGAAQSGYFPTIRNVFPGMMQQRPPRWAPPGAPGGPQSNVLRPLGMPTHTQMMMRPGQPSAVPQHRFSGNPTMPPHAPMGMPPGNQIRQQIGAPQQRPTNMPSSLNMGITGSNVRPTQVQYSMAIRNHQPVAGAGPVRSGTESSVANGQQSTASEAVHTLPIEEFMQLVQSKEKTDQKQLLGERLYSIVKSWYPQSAGKLTGMLLEIDNRDLMSMLHEHSKVSSTESSNLRNKCDSAMQVLSNAHQTGSAEGKREALDSNKAEE